MPLSIKKGAASKDMGDDGVLRSPERGGLPETQAVRIDGEVQHVVFPSAPAPLEDDDNAQLVQGLDDPDIVHDPNRSSVGEHLRVNAPESYASPQVRMEEDFDLNDFRKQQKTSGRLDAIIDQALEEIVAENSALYFPGWERDLEFVEATTTLVITSFDFEREDVLRVIKARAK